MHNTTIHWVYALLVVGTTIRLLVRITLHSKAVTDVMDSRAGSGAVGVWHCFMVQRSVCVLRVVHTTRQDQVITRCVWVSSTASTDGGGARGVERFGILIIKPVRTARREGITITLVLVTTNWDMTKRHHPGRSID